MNKKPYPAPSTQTSYPLYKRARKHLYTLLTLSIFAFIATAQKHACAQNETTQDGINQQQTSNSVNYAITESLGLLTAKDKGSYGKGLYQNTKRSDLVFLLKDLKQSNWISMRPALRDFLLTQADATALQNDVPITPGEDILTLRLKALTQLGYHKEAFSLYRKAAENSLVEQTVRAGIYAMLYNKQKGLACLEVKTVKQRFKSTPFWKEINTYCEHTLANKTQQNKTAPDNDITHPIVRTVLTSPDYTFAYTPENFTALSQVERAILTAEERISPEYITPETITKIPPDHISLLLTQESKELSFLQEALLLGAAIDYAIKPPQAMAKFYEKILTKYENQEQSDLSQATKDLLELAQLHQETTQSWLVTGRKEKIARALELAIPYTDKLLISFLPVIDKMEIDQEISLTIIENLAALFFHAPENIPEEWIEDLMKIFSTKNIATRKTAEKLAISLYLMRKDNKKALKNKIRTHLSTQYLNSNLAKSTKNIIENIDRDPNDGDKVSPNSVIGFDLANNKRYTMPPYYVSSALKQASQNQDISVSLLLSAHLLGKISKKETYIGVIDEIASALSNLGIKTTPRHLIAQAVLVNGEGS
ncbi:MAG: hypothetical protein ACLFU1_03100 [Alphaproteobacteria bacterium]